MGKPLEPLTEQEQRVLDMLHETNASVRAPASLRARIEASRPSRTTTVTRRLGYGGALAGAIAAAALALVLALPSGTPGSPSVSQAAALAKRSPTQPPPMPDRKAPGKLGRDVQEVYFPNWSGTFGWRAVGQRTDHLGGRSAVTVYYDWGGQRIAYTILTSPALPQPPGAVTQLNGTTLRTLTVGGRLVVTWRRAGHTCVLSGTKVTPSELQQLAAWKVPGLSV